MVEYQETACTLLMDLSGHKKRIFGTMLLLLKNSKCVRVTLVGNRSLT